MRKLMMGSVAVVMFSVCASSWAINGMPIEIAPSTEMSELATQSIGALMTEREFEDVDKSKRTIEHSRGNVVYIGEGENGSLLLTHAHRVTTDKKADPKLLETYKLMFGPAVTDLREGKLERRSWYPSLSDGKVYVYPAFQNAAEKSTESTDAVALIEMPVHFAAPRRPVTLIESGAGLPSKALYYVAGMGHESEESTDPNAVLSPYEAQKTSGKLRLAGLRLDSIFNQLTLRLSPYPSADWLAIHESVFPDDKIVDGPCEWDGGAPLFMEGTQISDINGEKVAKTKLVLVGLNYSSANTCIRAKSGKEAMVAMVNLTKPEIQSWIRKYLRK